MARTLPKLLAEVSGQKTFGAAPGMSRNLPLSLLRPDYQSTLSTGHTVFILLLPLEAFRARKLTATFT